MKMVKAFIKECFRYKISGFAMIICLVLSMLTAYYGVTIFKNIFFEYKEKAEYAYRYTTSFSCNVKSISDIPSLSQNIDCNLKIIDFAVCMEDSNITRIVKIIVNSHNEIIPLVEGNYLMDGEREACGHVVLIGRGLLPETYERDGVRYYNIFGDEYKVLGVLGAKNSTIFDDEIILYLDCLGLNTKKIMSENNESFNYEMVLQSDTVNTKKVFDDYLKGKYSASLNHYKSYNNATSVPVYNEKEFCILIYLFCFICIAVIMKFWIMQRLHEMQICKAFGYSNLRVVLRLLVSLECMMILSFVIFLFCLPVINFIIKESIKEYNLRFSWHIIGPYCLIYIVAILFVSIKPVYKMMSKSITINLREG